LLKPSGHTLAIEFDPQMWKAVLNKTVKNRGNFIAESIWRLWRALFWL